MFYMRIKQHAVICGASKLLRSAGFRRQMISQMSSSNNRQVVAVCQLTSAANKEDNFLACRRLIKKASTRGAQVVFLPECFDYVGESSEESQSMAESLDGSIMSRYQQLAKEENIWLSLGGFHEKGSDQANTRINNAHILVSSTGDIVARYCKAHLFDVDIKGGVTLKETDFVKPGTCIVPPVATPVGNIGMAVCYDLRFPELSTALAQLGADILTYPSAFTVPTGLAHWEVLLRSRAIENQCYVIAAAQTGRHNVKRTSYGHAMVVDPWGAVIAQCHEGTDVCFADIDLDYLHKVRQQMPVWSHRRYDLYGRITPLTNAPQLDSPQTYQFGQHVINSCVVFYKSALCIAFVNRKPVVPGHVLVLPLRVVKRFTDLSPEEVSDMFLTTQVVSKVIESHYNATALTVAIQDGADAGQTVQHVHVHILPRRPSDFKKNDSIYEELQTHDKDEAGNELPVDSPLWRSEEDMTEEATTLRALFS